MDQFVTNTTDVAGRNEPLRRNNATNTSSNTINHRAATRPTGHNGLQNDNSPNPSDPRNGPTCFRCGGQGHMRAECRERVFCNHCRSYNHDTKACRKQHNNIPSPAQSQIATGYHPTATPPPLMGTTAATQPTRTHNNPLLIIIIIIIIVIYSRSCLQFPLFEMFICVNEKWYIYKAVLPVPSRD